METIRLVIFLVALCIVARSSPVVLYSDGNGTICTISGMTPVDLSSFVAVSSISLVGLVSVDTAPVIVVSGSAGAPGKACVFEAGFNDSKCSVLPSSLSLVVAAVADFDGDGDCDVAGTNANGDAIVLSNGGVDAGGAPSFTGLFPEISRRAIPFAGAFPDPENTSRSLLLFLSGSRFMAVRVFIDGSATTVVDSSKTTCGSNPLWSSSIGNLMISACSAGSVEMNGISSSATLTAGTTTLRPSPPSAQVLDVAIISPSEIVLLTSSGLFQFTKPPSESWFNLPSHTGNLIWSGSTVSGSVSVVPTSPRNSFAFCKSSRTLTLLLATGTSGFHVIQTGILCPGSIFADDADGDGCIDLIIFNSTRFSVVPCFECSIFAQVTSSSSSSSVHSSSSSSSSLPSPLPSSSSVVPSTAHPLSSSHSSFPRTLSSSSPPISAPFFSSKSFVALEGDGPSLLVVLVIAIGSTLALLMVSGGILIAVIAFKKRREVPSPSISLEQVPPPSGSVMFFSVDPSSIQPPICDQSMAAGGMSNIFAPGMLPAIPMIPAPLPSSLVIPPPAIPSTEQPVTQTTS